MGVPFYLHAMLKHSVRVLFLILLATGCLVAQQRALTHADYDEWK